MDDWTKDPCERVSLGPMNAEEREELLAVAEELRARNIDPVFWLRALFIDTPRTAKPGRKRGSTRVRMGARSYPDPAEAERNERQLAYYNQTLSTLKGFHRDAPRAARTVAQLQAALNLGDGYEPYLEAVAEHRAARAQGRKGGATLEALAARLATGKRNESRALAELGRIRRAVDREERSRTTK